jgi:cobalt-zinc-cadmium efflux system protein
MEAVQGVREVHDFHIWTITSGFHALSAHVVLDEGLAMEEAELVLAALHKVASCDHGIEHVTIQLESRPPEWPRGEHFSP